MKILLSGSSGLIGSHLNLFLHQEGHQVVRLIRDKSRLGSDAIYWDPLHEEMAIEDFEGFDTVIHLAGAGIARKRWTPNFKKELFRSRCRDTWLLSQALCRVKHPPKTFICASAIGIYGNRGNEILTEESQPGSGFLADLCKNWESSTAAAQGRGIRVIHPRFGAVLGERGGLLHKFLTPIKLGLGARLGSGQQVMSWISIDDAVSAIDHCLRQESLQGPVNVTAPHAVTQIEFSREIAQKLNRPCFFSIPGWVLKMALGEMAEELILSSQNVKPKKLLEAGFVFRYPDLRSALDNLLSRNFPV